MGSLRSVPKNNTVFHISTSILTKALWKRNECKSHLTDEDTHLIRTCSSQPLPGPIPWTPKSTASTGNQKNFRSFLNCVQICGGLLFKWLAPSVFLRCPSRHLKNFKGTLWDWQEGNSEAKARKQFEARTAVGSNTLARLQRWLQVMNILP